MQHKNQNKKKSPYPLSERTKKMLEKKPKLLRVNWHINPCKKPAPKYPQNMHLEMEGIVANVAEDLCSGVDAVLIAGCYLPFDSYCINGNLKMLRNINLLKEETSNSSGLNLNV